MFGKCCGAVLLVTVSMLPLAASSHDAWLVPEGEELSLVYGHPGDLEPYNVASAREVYGVARDGGRQALPTRTAEDGLRVTPAADTSVVIVHFDDGVWTETPDEELVQRSKREVPGYRSATRHLMLHKSLTTWSEAATRPAGLPLEIVPLENPLAMQAGDEVRVQVFHDGQPLAETEIEILGSMDLYFTDAEGRVTLPISEPGLQYIQSLFRAPAADDPDADELFLTASLTFSL